MTASVVRAYLAALKAEADVETAEANIDLAKAVLSRWKIRRRREPVLALK